MIDSDFEKLRADASALLPSAQCSSFVTCFIQTLFINSRGSCTVSFMSGWLFVHGALLFGSILFLVAVVPLLLDVAISVK